MWVKHGDLGALRMVNRNPGKKTSLEALEDASSGWSFPTSAIQGHSPWHLCPCRLKVLQRNFSGSFGILMLCILPIFLIRGEPGGSGDNKATEMPHNTTYLEWFVQWDRSHLQNEKRRIHWVLVLTWGTQRQELWFPMLKDLHHCKCCKSLFDLTLILL